MPEKFKNNPESGSIEDQPTEPTTPKNNGKEPHFLEHYKVHEKPEASRAAKRKELKTKEKGVVFDRSKRIEAYLERLEEIFTPTEAENPSVAKIQEGRVNTYKEKFLYPAVIVKEEDFPEEYFDHQKQEARRMGLGEVSFTKEEKDKEILEVQDAQKKSLDSWIDYLTSDDCSYPNDIKYFAMQGVLKLGSFNTKKYSFDKRRPSTTSTFCEIDREALSVVLGALEARYHKKDTSNYSQELLKIIEDKKSFGDMYARAMQELDKKAQKEQMIEITDGEWRTFAQGSNPQELVDAMSGKRSNLCIADIGQATRYLNQGDMHIYFSYNRAKEPAMPRLALATKSEVGAYEVRGTWNTNEDIDPTISKTDILLDRLKGIPNGESFAKKDTDMRKLTSIDQQCFKRDRKTGKIAEKINSELSKEELHFLYELDGAIEGFGYQKDPRIKEMRDSRDKEKDMLILFECTKDQIVHNPSEINENIKVYVGEWNPDVLQLLPEGIEHVYESFPDKKVFLKTIKIENKFSSPKDYSNALQKEGYRIDVRAETMLNNLNYGNLQEQELDLVSFFVRQLGFRKGAKLKDILKKAQELGLKLCPKETGPQLRMQYKDQPMDEWLRIGMEPIAGSDGYLNVFDVGRNADGSWLSSSWGSPAIAWSANFRFVFVRPSK